MNLIKKLLIRLANRFGKGVSRDTSTGAIDLDLDQALSQMTGAEKK